MCREIAGRSPKEVGARKREVGTGRSENRASQGTYYVQREEHRLRPNGKGMALTHYRAHHLRACPLDVESIIKTRKRLCSTCASQVFLSGLRPCFSTLTLLLSGGSQLPGTIQSGLYCSYLPSSSLPPPHQASPLPHPKNLLLKPPG